MECDGKQKIFVGGNLYYVDPEYADAYLEECLRSIGELEEEIDKDYKRVQDIVKEMMSNVFFEEVGNRVLALLNNHQRELREMLKEKRIDLEKSADESCPFEE